MKRIACILAVLTMIISGCSGIDWFPETDPNAPFAITVTADPTSPVVGGTTTITATVDKADGTPVADGTTVSFVTTGGTLSAFSATTVGGEATVTLTGPATAGSVTVTASSGIVSNTASVTFVPPVTVTVSANPNPVSITGGVTSTTITATVKNADGTNIANGTNMDFTATAGNLSSASAQTTNGIATVTLNVAGLISGTSITITATQRDTTNSGTTVVTII